MTSVAVVGDGPAGLSAALFLAKNGVEVTVYGGDETNMHYAHLHNYLGVPDIGGSRFQEIAREQVDEQGAALVEEEVTGIARSGERFTVRTADGTESTVDHVIVAGGKPSTGLLEELRAEVGPDGPRVDLQYRTTVDRVYAVGRVARPARSQAIISAGAGAVAALDILSREAGRDVTDWDTPDDAG